MDKIIGFVGYGNMAYAMVNGIVEQRILPTENIIVSKRNISEEDKENAVYHSDQQIGRWLSP